MPDEVATLVAQPAGTPPASEPGGGGFLDHIKTPEPSPADSQATPETPPASESAEKAIPAPAEAPKPGEQTPAEFKTTIRGRVFTGDELAKAYENSSAEGIRLNSAYKETTRHITELEAKLAEMQERLEETPPFKLLTDDEIAGLDTTKQLEYFVKKNAWETEKANRKQNLARMQEESKKAEEAEREYIYSRTQHMHDTPAEWPYYQELMGTMNEILDRVPFIGGMKETPDVLYYCALGLQKSREMRAQRTTNAQSQAEAAAQATAQAAAVGGGAPRAPVRTPTPPEEDSDEAFANRILSKVQKPIFQ